MKITCDFCKTEYNLAAAPAAPVKCAVCGNVWTVRVAPRKNALMLLFASVCALLAAVVFTVAVIARHQVDSIQNRPLVASVSDIRTVMDAAGVPHFVVSGTVLNQSDEIYGMPDLIIISRDENGNAVAQQKFMPSVTLLDAGASATFSHTLSAPATGVKKITVELMNMGAQE